MAALDCFKDVGRDVRLGGEVRLRTPSRKQSKGWWDSGFRLQEIEWGWRCRFKDNKSCRSVLIKEGDQVEIEVAEISSLENAFDSWKGNGEKPVKE